VKNAGAIFDELVVKTLQNLYESAFRYGSKAVFVLLIIGIGWICAVILKKVCAKMLRALGFDVVSERAGISSLLQKGGIGKQPSALIGSAFYWLILLSALMMAFNALEMETASQLLRQTVLYLPKIIAALVLLSLGGFLGHFVAELVESASKVSHAPFPEALAKIARWAVIAAAAMMALETLDIAKDIVTNTFVIVFGVAPVAAIALLLFAGCETLANALAGKTIAMDFKPGDEIEMEDVSGEIVSIDAVTTKVKEGDEIIVLPNSMLAENKVKKKSHSLA